MHRDYLQGLLSRYIKAYPDESECALRISEFAKEHSDCLLRSCLEGHITASAWILSADHKRCLLTHHRKLERWLQLGGHVDGESIIEKAAFREAQEESGIEEFDLIRLELEDGGLVPFDIDIHEITARKTEPKHNHLDLRFLLVASQGEQLTMSDESIDLKWIELSQLKEYSQEESVLRLQRKTELGPFAALL